MFLKVLGWLSGSGIAAIGKQLNDAYKAKLDAKNDSERLEAEQAIAQLEARRGVLVAESQSALTAWIRPALAAPFVIFVWKVVVWDKVMGIGTTDPLSDNMSWVMSVVLGAYFLTRPLEKLRR